MIGSFCEVISTVFTTETLQERKPLLSSKMSPAYFVLILSILSTAAAFTARSVGRPSSCLRSTLTPDDFIRLTKEYLANPSADKLADDYVFRGPIVGPLVKKVST